MAFWSFEICAPNCPRDSSPRICIYTFLLDRRVEQHRPIVLPSHSSVVFFWKTPHKPWCFNAAFILRNRWPLRDSLGGGLCSDLGEITSKHFVCLA